MNGSRRALLTSLLASGGGALAACGTRDPRPPIRGVLDVTRLSQGFTALSERANPGVFNLGVLTLGDGKSWNADERTRYPMQSVAKAPLAAAVLAEVDAGRMTLSERLEIAAADLSATPSRINALFPARPGAERKAVPLVDLIALAVQRGDNTAADVLMRRLGGPGAVSAWLRARGIDGISLDRYEREIQVEVCGLPAFNSDWADEATFLAARDTVPAARRELAMNGYLTDQRDTATTPGALAFLGALAEDRLLAPASTRLLLRFMETVYTGDDRLKAGLPRGARLAHMTGTARTDLGLTPATNDIGIVTLPGGARLAVAAFLAGSVATEVQRYRLFADAARLIFASLS